MTFNEWLSAQYKTGRLNQKEIEQATDKLRKEEDACMGCVYIHTDNYTTISCGDITAIRSQVYWGKI